ncbi:MAG: hypothetical protein ACYDBT_04095 [Desulfobulbaceae bacterium]
MMKNIAIIANVILLGVSILLSIDEMRGGLDAEELFFISIFLVTPLLSIIVLVSTSQTADGWISLWFKRKALEEKKKIEELSSK